MRNHSSFHTFSQNGHVRLPASLLMPAASLYPVLPAALRCDTPCEGQACPAKIFGTVRSFHAGEGKVRGTGILQADGNQELDGMIIILRDCRLVVRLQDSPCLLQRPVKKLHPHAAFPHSRRQALHIFLIIKICSY